MRWLILFVASAGLLRANDTAVNAAGHAPWPLGDVPNEESVIRMVSEKIDIVFGKEQSKVHCRFVFRSTKKGGDAKQLVGFPDLIDTHDTGEILSMVTKIDGKKVESKKEKGWFMLDEFYPRGGLGPLPKPDQPVQDAEYHTVEVTFPEGKDVIIEREYVVANGGSYAGNTIFYYTTLTGSIWQGTIGRAEFTVTLDGWTIDDLAFEDGPQKIEPRKQGLFCSVNRSEWTIESPTKLSLVWENFEPAVHTSRREILLTTWRTVLEPK